MRLAALFALAIALTAAGAFAGGMLGSRVAPGGLLFGAFLVGTVCVLLSAWLAQRWGWIRRPQRLWCMLGGAFGFALACVVALATIMTPGALAASLLLVGVGAVLGAVVGVSPHAEA